MVKGAARIGKRGISDGTLLLAVRTVMSVAVVLVIIIPFFGNYLGLPFGGGGKAYAADNGFSRLVRCSDDLVGSAEGEFCDVSFTIDQGLYLVAFNRIETSTAKASKPPDCNGVACMCVCPDEKCEKIDAERNRGRDCRPFYGYDSMIAQKDIKGNSGGKQAASYINPDGTTEEGRYFYVEGEKTIFVRIHMKGSSLFIGKQP